MVVGICREFRDRASDGCFTHFPCLSDPGKFRHFPVVENSEVIGILDITKCLYDAISRMEKAAEQGSVLAVAVEGQWGNNSNAPIAFVEMLRDRMSKPALSTITTESTNDELGTTQEVEAQRKKW